MSDMQSIIIIIYSAITTNNTKQQYKQYFQMGLEQQKQFNYCDP